EVRSPAAAMKNTLAGIMQWDDTIDTVGRRTLLQEAYESSDRLLSLVESQLIIAKLETRHFEPTPGPVDLASALPGVIAVLNHRYAERTEAVQVNIPDNLPPAFCEPAHLAQVLTNLIGNALEYTSSSVQVEARQVQRPGGPWEALLLNGRLVGWAEHGGLRVARQSAELGERFAQEHRDYLLGRLGHKLRSSVLALQESARQAAFGRPDMLEGLFE